MARKTLEIADNNRRCTCAKCGRQFPQRNGNFAKSYSDLNRGIGYTMICKDCIDKLYTDYLDECGEPMHAVRQVCRKLDLYWSESVYDKAFIKSTVRTVMSRYMVLLTQSAYAGLSYDDTLKAEGKLWDFKEEAEKLEFLQKTREELEKAKLEKQEEEKEEEPEEETLTLDDIDDSVKQFWGRGYDAEMYRDLEDRRKFWMSKYPEDVELDMGTEAIIRQICSLELDINRDRAAGRSIEKSVNALNTLLGSANLKPAQRDRSEDSALENTPLGVWLYRYENERPLPTDEYEDSALLRYTFIWMGHLCKMLGIKGSPYAKMYQDEIDRLRVERPEYEGDDEELFMEYMNGGDDDGD